MSTTLKLKNSVTTTAAPSSLVQGEVAVNVTDKKVWVGNAASSPVQIVGAGAPVSGTTLTMTGDGTFSGTGQVKVPSGTTAQRSGSPVAGMFRYNSSTSEFEGYDGSAWVSLIGNGGPATTGPAFSVYLASSQSVTSATATKVALDTEEFDTDACFNTSTNRFTPTVAGYYQINGCLYAAGTANTQGNAYVYIYKNGSVYKQGESITTTAADGTGLTLVLSTLVYLNGSTDYIELWGSNQQTGPVFGGGQGLTYFNGSFIRA